MQTEKLLIYGSAFLLCALVIGIYLLHIRRRSRRTARKIGEAKAAGTHEPVSLHPVVDPNACIGTGACILACPEKDILGILHGKAAPVNTSRCIGHGACFHACPTRAISLCIGTEQRGVQLPHVNEHFVTNVPGISIAGELGGMGLIRNAVEQGRQAVEHIGAVLDRRHEATYDLLVVGAGPAGIAGSLAAKKLGLRFLTLEQDTLGGTVATFPRKKVVMTSPMELPLHGRVKMLETSKTELLTLWQEVLGKNGITIRENTKVERIEPEHAHLRIVTSSGETFTAKHVLLAIGRRGSPRKLNIPGEERPKVAYRMLEPEMIRKEHIMVVGGGDSAVEAALQLCDENKVTLSYRKENFSRIKPANFDLIRAAMAAEKLDVRFNTELRSIDDEDVTLTGGDTEEHIRNDRVYIFVGGELPSGFLEKSGIRITTSFGDTVLSHHESPKP
ncbi:MAG: NAD(P)-binding domain-containing protein [Bacteroidales bacterium]